MANGFWQGGTLAFNLKGWIAHDGPRAYKGPLKRGALVITACECSDAVSQIIAGSQ